METKVTFIYDYKNIDIPEPLVDLKIDLRGFIETQCEMLAQKHSKIELPDGQSPILTDDMVKAEELPGVETVEQYRAALEREVPQVIVSEQANVIVMHVLIPQLVERSTFEINDEEASAAGQETLEAFEKQAEEIEISVEELGRRQLGVPTLDEGQVRQHVLTMGRTDFLFRVLAKEYYRRQGQVYDLAGYAAYVKELEEMSDMTEDQIRAIFPPHVFMNEMPTLAMLDELTRWVTEKIHLTTE